MSYVSTIKCPHCGVRNSAQDSYCRSCRGSLYGNLAEQDEHYRMYTPQRAPVFDPLAAGAPPVSTAEMIGWGCASVLLPIVGVIITYLWTRKDRPNAQGCYQAAIGWWIFAIITNIIGFCAMQHGAP